MRARNLLVTDLENVLESKTTQTKKSWFFRKRFSAQKLMLFTRQFATLLSSGMEIDAALKLIATQADNKDIHKAATRIRSYLSEGMTLAQAMRQSGISFSNDYLATIAAGEETGHMVEVMDRLADEVEHATKTMQGLLSALLYPAIMLTVALSITIFLMVSIVPSIAGVFTNMNQSLPTMTRLLISMSDFLIAYGLYFLIIIIACALLFIARYKSSSVFRIKVHKNMLRMPFLGPLLLASQIARWSRSFGMLLASGVSTLQALHVSVQTITNQHLFNVLQEVISKVREGQALYLALQTQKIIPSFVVHMCSSGESSGNLDNMMLKVSDYYVQSVRMTTETGVKLFEPILIVVMGGVVMTIVLAILLPVFELNTFV